MHRVGTGWHLEKPVGCKKQLLGGCEEWRLGRCKKQSMLASDIKVGRGEERANRMAGGEANGTAEEGGADGTMSET